MSEAAPDGETLEAWIGFPDPPHRIRAGRSRTRLMAGYIAAALLFLIGLGLLIAYFGFDRAGRGLLVDTALAAGLGSPLPGARVNIGGCEYAGTRAGSRLPGQWTCTATVIVDRQPTVLTLDTVSRFDLRPSGAGTILGRIGIYWPAGVLAARWWNVAILLVIGFGLMAIALAALCWAAPDRRLMRARKGRIRVVDLLTWRGRPWFAFPDDRGRTRFQRADSDTVPLVLDGLRTRGAALVSGRSAVLLDAQLQPLELPEEERAPILEKAAILQREGQRRVPLQPQPGDPPTLMRRIERVENQVAAEPAKAELARLYDEAWRLTWDSDHDGVSNRALHARNTIAKVLGPRRAHGALQECRRRYG